ncbi:hypothetical protein MRO49_24835, partial [Escherichia coli]|uniref:hypothetical protein n=1 Tax=Escherichia coli TaxID=562 RepID=UPI00211441A6
MSTLLRRPARAWARAPKRSAFALTIAALLAANAQAQDATAPQSEPAQAAEQGTAGELDSVVVTGIRGSVYRAQDIKRSA